MFVDVVVVIDVVVIVVDVNIVIVVVTDVDAFGVVVCVSCVNQLIHILRGRKKSS